MTGKRRTAVIIGAGGQIGGDLAVHLDQSGYDVHMVDMFPPERTPSGELLRRYFGAREEWPGRRWSVGDATSLEFVSPLLSNRAPEVTFHLAATLSATGENDPAACWHLNVGSLRVVLDVLSGLAGRRLIGGKTGPDGKPYRPKLVWPSSIASFGPIPDRPNGGLDEVDNESPTLPTTMYGVTKVVGEQLGSYYAARLGVDFRSVRFPGLLNATPPGGGTTDYANLMYQAAARGAGECTIFVKPETRLPFMYMPDAVKALRVLAEAPEERLTRRVYNIGALSPTAREIEESIAQVVPGFRCASAPDHRQAIAESWPRVLLDGPARRDWGWQPACETLDVMTASLIADFKSADVARAAAPAPSGPQAPATKPADPRSLTR